MKDISLYKKEEITNLKDSDFRQQEQALESNTEQSITLDLSADTTSHQDKVESISRSSSNLKKQADLQEYFTVSKSTENSTYNSHYAKVLFGDDVGTSQNDLSSLSQCSATNFANASKASLKHYQKTEEVQKTFAISQEDNTSHILESNLSKINAQKTHVLPEAQASSKTSNQEINQDSSKAESKERSKESSKESSQDQEQEIVKMLKSSSDCACSHENNVYLEKNSLNFSNKKISKAVIVSKVYHRPVGGAILEIAELLNKLGVEAYIDQNTAVGFNLDQIPITTRKLTKQADMIIVVGGDGSLLGAARSLVDYEIPVLGINRGHLGLLTDLSPNDLEWSLTKIVEGKYSIEDRMMLDVRVFRKDEDNGEELLGQSLAMNETVVHSGILAHMIVCRVYINGRFMYSLRSDGIIVGTPTGSTAYSLSAGGPIIEPHLDVLSLVPMFPQSLNCSPIVLPGKSKVEIEFDYKPDLPEWVNINCDGQVTIRADTKCVVSIRQHHTPLKLIHPENYDYYSVLRKKLGWGQSIV